MKSFELWGLAIGLNLLCCNQIYFKTENRIEQLEISDKSKDEREILILIRNVLIWANSKNTIGSLPPALKNSKGNIYTEFDLNKHRQNLRKLKTTNTFSQEFIDNYNKIIVKLNNGLKNGSYGKWLVGDLPPFNFGSEVDPWSLCQDVPYDKPNPLEFIEVEILKLDSVEGKLNWKWGRLDSNTDSGWKKFKYKFKVIKENKKWKIAYLEGFDFEKSTRKF